MAERKNIKNPISNDIPGNGKPHNLLAVNDAINENFTLPEKDHTQIIENKLFVKSVGLDAPQLAIRINNVDYSVLLADDRDVEGLPAGTNSQLGKTSSASLFDPSIINLAVDSVGIQSGQFAYISSTRIASVASSDAFETALTFGFALGTILPNFSGDFKLFGLASNSNWSLVNIGKYAYLGSDGYPSDDPGNIERRLGIIYAADSTIVNPPFDNPTLARGF